MKNTHLAERKQKNPLKIPNSKEVYVYAAFQCRLNSNMWTSLVRLKQLIFHLIII